MNAPPDALALHTEKVWSIYESAFNTSSILVYVYTLYRGVSYGFYIIMRVFGALVLRLAAGQWLKKNT